MTHLIGVEHRNRFTVLNSSGDLVTGETFVIDQAIGPDGNAFAVTVEEIGSGLYEQIYTPALSGTYYARLTTETVLTSPPQYYEFQDNDDDAEADAEIAIYLTILDDDGEPYDGAGFTVQFALGPGASTFAPITVGLGDGLYRTTWTPTQAGIYTLRLLADLSAIGDDDQLFEFERRIAPVDVDVSPFIQQDGSTLEDIIRGIALRCRDYIDTMVTSDATVGDRWPDSLTLAATSPKSFKGANLFVLNAAVDANVGREVRVLDSRDGELILTPALPSPPRAGDIGYLVNLESSGFMRQTYINEANANLRGSFPNYAVPLAWTFTEMFSGDLPYLTPPPEFTHISSVSYQVPGWSPYPVYVPLGDQNTAGWWWDSGAGRLVIGGGYRDQANGTFVEIRGFGRSPRLTVGSQTTGADYQWLVAQSAGNLVWSLRDPKRAAEAANSINRADSYLIKGLTMYPPDTIRIR